MAREAGRESNRGRGQGVVDGTDSGPRIVAGDFRGVAGIAAVAGVGMGLMPFGLRLTDPAHMRPALSVVAKMGLKAGILGAAVFGVLFGGVELGKQLEGGAGTAATVGGVLGAAALVGGGVMVVSRGAAGAGATTARAASPGLDEFATELVAEARAGNLARASGVDHIIDDLISVLLSPRKNNPVLVAPPGVGKTAIVEELANRIARGDVPEGLRNARIHALDVNALEGDASLVGQFEGRMQRVVESIVSSRSRGEKAFLFVDETHRLVTAGQSGAQLSAANSGPLETLKPYMARGQIGLIGATTPSAQELGALRRNAALARRITEIHVPEPDAAQTLRIVQRNIERFETPRLRFTNAALSRAVEKSAEAFPGRHEPDRTMSLLERASARLGMASDTAPEELVALRNQVDGIDAELAILRRETTQSSRDAVARMEEQLGGLRPRLEHAELQWQHARRIRDEALALELSSEGAQAGAASSTARGELASLLDAESEAVRHYPDLFRREVQPADIDAVVAAARPS